MEYIICDECRLNGTMNCLSHCAHAHAIESFVGSDVFNYIIYFALILIQFFELIFNVMYNTYNTYTRMYTILTILFVILLLMVAFMHYKCKCLFNVTPT